MLTRSLSYYTIGRQQSQSQLELANATDLDFSAGLGGGLATPSHIASMPRSISLNKLSFAASPGHGHGHGAATTTPLFKHGPLSHYGAPGRLTRGSTTVELVEDATPPTPTLPQLGAKDLHHPKRETNLTPPDSSFIPNSTSPEGFLQTEAGSLPIMTTRTLGVGSALIHPPAGDLAVSTLPAALVEDFEIIGRAGDGGECTGDAWIVRSKCSGKLGVFKPRDGESFQERKLHEDQERDRQEKEERMRRIKQRGPTAATPSSAELVMAPASSSCPHPLSLTTSLRTPLKRGVMYGETTRKEVAAYLMDHEHFAGVPKTLEATIWLQRQDAPNGGINQHDSGVHNWHPYLPAGESRQLTLTTGSPDLRAQPSPAVGGGGLVPNSSLLLLQAASVSPPLTACPEEHGMFAFDAEDVWLPAAAMAGAYSPEGRTRSTADQHKHTHKHDHHHHHNTNLAPPPTLFAAAAAPSNHSSARTSTVASPACGPLAAPLSASGLNSPEFLPTSIGTPEDANGLSLPPSSPTLIATYGSLQEFVENKGSAEDMGSNAFPSDEVHRIGILDVRLLNLDRHLGNLLVQRDEAGRPHLIPIDHGFCLGSVASLRDVRLEYTYWPQTFEPYSPDTLRYIAALDPMVDARMLSNLGFRSESILPMVISTMLLQHTARLGFSLHHIALLVQRQHADCASPLERIISFLPVPRRWLPIDLMQTSGGQPDEPTQQAETNEGASDAADVAAATITALAGSLLPLAASFIPSS